MAIRGKANEVRRDVRPQVTKPEVFSLEYYCAPQKLETGARMDQT